MILYKKDTKGKIRYLKVWHENCNIFQESGVVGTDNPLLHQKVAKPKNLGRSNETTSEEQASLEVQSLIKKKIDGGYFTSLKEAEQENVILPMLALDYNKEKHKVKWENAYAERKFDGQRCLAFIRYNKVSLISRKGVKIENMKHIENSLLEIFPNMEIVLDGELYTHGESFQTNMSYIKKYQKGLTEKIKLHVYDIVSDENQDQRIKCLESYKGLSENIEIVEAVRVFSETNLINIHKLFILEGYEGSILRWGDQPYKINGRSQYLLKYKDFIDDVAMIIDVIPAEQRPSWGTPVFEGFKSGVRMTHEQREDLLTNKHEYIGKMAEIRFFEYTDDGKPRFPICIGIRNDK